MLPDTQMSPSKVDREQVLEVVKSIVADNVTISSDKIREQHDLESDLGCDSLDIAEISMEIEDHFEITIPDEIADHARNVGAIVDGLMQLLGQK
jgi:acyl carrier protein